MKVIFVDAGNYCRSPAAEVVARALAGRAGKAADWRFGSAGLKDKHVGDAADPRSVSACARRGYDLSGFRCRQIGAADFANADLLLAMDRDNLAQLAALRPPGARAQARLFLGEAEVPDPYYGGDVGFEQMLDLIEGGVRALIGDGR